MDETSDTMGSLKNPMEEVLLRVNGAPFLKLKVVTNSN